MYRILLKKPIFLSVLIFAFSVTAGEINFQSPGEDLTITPHAYGHFQFSQLVRATGISDISGDYTKRNLYTENAYTGLSMDAQYGEHLKMVFGIELKMYFSWPQQKDVIETKWARQDAIMGPTYAKLTYPTGSFGELNLYTGYFEYKYNPDVRNLGEFMFRSATYPAYIITYFDYPLAKLLGGRVNYNALNKSLRLDLMLTSETVFYPAMDWTLSFLANYDIANLGFIDVGLGVSLSHLFSVYDSTYDRSLGGLTDPESDETTGNAYYNSDSSKSYYTFRGDKVMGRLSVDPKFLIPGSEDVFGKNDLKMYVEALIIGIKSYPDTTAGGVYQPSYARWQEKTPVTFGFNLPTFKILDLLNLEFEYFGSKYFNTYYDIFITSSLPNAELPVTGISESKWKWSVFAKKSFFNGHTAITVQMARDHMRLPSASYTKANHREMLVEDGNWWWTVKTSYQF